MNDVADRSKLEPPPAATAKPQPSRRKIVRLGIVGVIAVAALVGGVA